MKICLIKLGTDSIITTDGEVNKEVLITIKEQILTLKKLGVYSVLVCSGAVDMGKKRYSKIQLSETNALRIYASIGQPFLINEIQSIFYSEFIISQILLTSYDFSNLERRSILTHTIYDMLQNGIIPVINENDLISNEELDCIPTFNDNDSLAVNVASLISASWLFILSAGIDGLYKDYDKKELGIYSTIENLDSIANSVSEAKSNGGRGGMSSKLISIKKGVENNIKVFLINGFKAYNIVKAINKSNDFVGTSFNSKS
jgi:glutamate 5-kinase